MKMPWIIVAIVLVLAARSRSIPAVASGGDTAIGSVSPFVSVPARQYVVGQSLVNVKPSAVVPFSTRFNRTTKAGVIVDTTGTKAGAVAEARAEDQQYKQFQALVKRADLSSGPIQSQQWNRLLTGNQKGIIPDSAFSFADMSDNLAYSNLQNDIALSRGGSNTLTSRVGMLE